jgi:hypothetical protein
VHRQYELLHVIRALHPSGCFASLLDGRQQKCYQDANNGDNDKKLYQSEAAIAFALKKLHEDFSLGWGEWNSPPQ